MEQLSTREIISTVQVRNGEVRREMAVAQIWVIALEIKRRGSISKMFWM